MATLNKVMLIGRLTDNPEPPRVLPNSGSTVVKFRFAVGRSKKNPQTGQWESDPNPLYIDCEAFSRADNNRLTDIISQYCSKGSQILVEGRLQLDTWEDKQNPGQKRSKHKVVVENVQFLDTRGGGQGGGGGGEFEVGEGGGGAPRGGGGGYGGPPRGGSGGPGGGGNYGGGGGGKPPQQPQRGGGGGNYSPPPDDDMGGGGGNDDIPF